MIIEYVVKKALDEIYGAAKRLLNDKDEKLISDTSGVEAAIRDHLQLVSSWSEEVSFLDLKRARLTKEIFIQPYLYVMPRRRRVQPDETLESISLKEIVNDDARHCVLLGQPGAGKTTSMKHLCQALFLDEEFGCEGLSFPILIRFRDLNVAKASNDATLLIDSISNTLGVRVGTPDGRGMQASASHRKSIMERLVISILNSLGVLLILDGFDELTDPDKRKEALIDIRNLAARLDKATMIVTCRTGEFEYSIENLSQYELCPLNSDQITLFASRWLQDKQLVAPFLKQIHESPFIDTAVRPLTLAHLAAIYERIGEIPKKPRTVYRKVINLLLEEWDQQRSVKRTSRYANFAVDRKFEFLCHLSYTMTALLQKMVFSHEDLVQVYDRIYPDYDLAPNEAKQVVNELESHTGLLVQTSYEAFEFAHKSLQEYLAAEYIVRLPSIPNQPETLSQLPNELAIAVTISSDPGRYLDKLVLNRLLRIDREEGTLRAGILSTFVGTFVSRLLLEKPDFYIGAEYGIALLILHHLMLIGSVESNFYKATHDGEFENLIQRLLPEKTLMLITQAFDRSKVRRTGPGSDIYLMVKQGSVRRKAVSSESDYHLVNMLPNRFYIRESVLDRGPMPRHGT
jgi:hypothetical protein